MGETETLARFVAGTGYGDLPPDAVGKAKEAIRDAVGVSLYGSTREAGRIVADYVDAGLPGDAATVIGRGTAGPEGAALANGTFAHAIDFDDSFGSIMIHPSAPTFPAALAAVEHAGGTGRDLLASYAVGIDATYRVGEATYPTHMFGADGDNRGWHGTGTIGSFGAAAAAASALGLDVGATRRALGIVGSCSSTLRCHHGTMTKPLHPGHAAGMGVRAALLASAGFTANPSVFEGRFGYGRTMTRDDSYDPSAVERGADGWAVHDITYKPYPSGVITHAAMEALGGLLDAEGLDAGDVASISVTLDEAADEVLERDPADATHARFSIEFCLAAVLLEGDVGPGTFTDEFVNAAATREQMAKVVRDFRPEVFGDGTFEYGVELVVETADGTEHEAAMRYPPGSPHNPMSEGRLEAKFEACAVPAVGEAGAAAVRDAIDGLDRAPALDPLAGALRAG